MPNRDFGPGADPVRLVLASYDPFGLVLASLKSPASSLGSFDFPAFVDALADLDYVIEGTRAVCGVDGRPIHMVVHAANMAKEPAKDSEGAPNPLAKPIKPFGWVPPDIAAELKAQGWKPGDDETCNVSLSAESRWPLGMRGVFEDGSYIQELDAVSAYPENTLKRPYRAPSLRHLSWSCEECVRQKDENGFERVVTACSNCLPLAERTKETHPNPLERLE